MMKYYLSQYVKIIEGKDYVALYNFINGNMIIVYSEDELKVLQRIRNEEEVDESNLSKKLYDDYFIFQEEDTPEKVLEYIYRNSNYCSGTLAITLIFSEACNFRCDYCYEDYDGHFIEEETKLGILNFIKQYIHENSTNKVVISWFGGEPTLFKDAVIDFMMKVRETVGTEIKVVGFMTTNAYLLSADAFSEYYQAGIVGYQITVDGFAHTHNKLRKSRDGKETWETILNNLQSIADSMYDDVFVLLRINYNAEVYQELVDFIEYIKNRFNNSFVIHTHPITQLGSSERDSICDPYTLEMAEIEIGDYFANHETQNDFAELRASLFGGVCYAAKRNSYLIDSYGCIRKCTVDLHGEDNCVGQIIDSSTFTIDVRALARWTETRIQTPECTNCCIYPTCMGRTCPHSALSDNHTCRTNKKAIFHYLEIIAHRAYVALSNKQEEKVL